MMRIKVTKAVIKPAFLKYRLIDYFWMAFLYFSKSKIFGCGDPRYKHEYLDNGQIRKND